MAAFSSWSRAQPDDSNAIIFNIGQVKMFAMREHRIGQQDPADHQGCGCTKRFGTWAQQKTFQPRACSGGVADAENNALNYFAVYSQELLTLFLILVYKLLYGSAV